MIWPVYEFRPLPTSFRPGVRIRRYAEGAWLDDDGGYDLAFIGDFFCLMFEPPYQKNIICSWTTGHWSAHEPRHPNGNAWHHALREGAKDWGGDWGRDGHPNRIAGRAGMDKVASERRCANGRHVEMHPDDPIIAAGLLRERDTKSVFRWPTGMVCMYCGETPPLPLTQR